MKKVGIVAAGSYVPARKLTNADLEKMVDTTDEWITTRTGIKERRIAGHDEHASDLAFKAAQDCLAQTAYRPELLIAATSTAEKSCPYQASIVAHRLGLTDLAAFDVNAVCSGFLATCCAIRVKSFILLSSPFKNHYKYSCQYSRYGSRTSRTR